MNIDGEVLGQMMGMIVHDLRNPGATIGANVSYVKEVMGEEDVDDVPEALSDAEAALEDLMRGLEQVAWVGRWISGQPALGVADGDVVESLRMVSLGADHMKLVLELPATPLPAKGGGTLVKLANVLVSNSVQHARKGDVVVAARQEGDEVVVEVRDGGAAIAPELRTTAFTLEGQFQLKGRIDGRYGRVIGLLAAKVLAEAMDAELEADGVDGAAIFRIRLKKL